MAVCTLLNPSVGQSTPSSVKTLSSSQLGTLISLQDSWPGCQPVRWIINLSVSPSYSCALSHTAVQLTRPSSIQTAAQTVWHASHARQEKVETIEDTFEHLFFLFQICISKYLLDVGNVYTYSSIRKKRSDISQLFFFFVAFTHKGRDESPLTIPQISGHSGGLEKLSVSVCRWRRV